MNDFGLKATIIMPTYRRAHSIRRSIATVLAQAYPNWELIVSNNGPDPYRFDDPRIRVIDSSAVTGAAYARNQAIPHATGDLISFLDDDDELEPDYLASFADVFARLPVVQMGKCHMIRRGVLNLTYGTPTVVLRRRYATPTWEATPRHDRAYYQAIIERHGFSEEAGTLYVIARPLCRSGVDPEGGLRAGRL
jgi:glycosyltransferase involved in cell wall biosynthesis